MGPLGRKGSERYDRRLTADTELAQNDERGQLLEVVARKLFNFLGKQIKMIWYCTFIG